jgi:hypothetical protein
MRSNSWFEAYTTFWKWKTAIQRAATERPDPACAHFKVTPRRVTTCRTRNNKMSLSHHPQGLPCALAVSPTRLGNVHAPFRSFRASLIGINSSSSNRAFFHQPGESVVCGFSFSFVALSSAFTASVRNGPGLYTLAKGVSSVSMVGAGTPRGVDYTLQAFVASSASFAVCFDACLHLLYLPRF